MNSDRGWYLVAVGVLALGISNSSVGDSARGFLDRAAALADHVSARAIQAVAVAQLMSDRGDAGWAHAQTAVAKAQVRMALAQARIEAKRAVSTRVQSSCALGAWHRVTVPSSEDVESDPEDLQ
jgi:hypothetical protein